ncbi:MAG: hypothetical protein ABSD89_07080 [Halobacteriota archaeon]
MSTTSNPIEGTELLQARKTIVHIINSLSPSSRLKGVHIDDIVSYSESLGIYPESVIGVIQQLAKEGLVVEPSKNRFLNRFPPVTIPKNNQQAGPRRSIEQAVDSRRDTSDNLEKKALLLEKSHILLTPEQLLQIEREYTNIMASGNLDFFYDGYPNDAEIGKRVGIDKRKIQGARVLLGLLTERDVKINFDREKLLEWLSAPKSARKSSKDFADELGVSYSTFKRKRALWEAYLSKSSVSSKSFE